jgi:pilus assembly protein Flp/PilA
MWDKFVCFLKDEEGQTSTEYILLVAVVALIVFKFKAVAQSKLESLTNSIFDKAESEVMQGFGN